MLAFLCVVSSAMYSHGCARQRLQLVLFALLVLHGLLEICVAAYSSTMIRQVIVNSGCY